MRLLSTKLHTHLSIGLATSLCICFAVVSVDLNAHEADSQSTSWFIETRQITPQNIIGKSSNESIGKDWWKQDTINHAYIGANAWGFGREYMGAGPSSNLNDAFVRWELVDKKTLRLSWFVGGYHQHFSGKPSHGWNQDHGGNTVKAYPRMGIGSASGQPFATSGSPDAVPVQQSRGVKTVDQVRVSEIVGIPSRVTNLPNIDIHIETEFEGGSDDVPPKDKYGSFFFAIDSYFHDIDNADNLSSPALLGSLNGINDSRGKIFNVSMDDLPATTKKWAMMIWYHKPPYYESSGGIALNNNKTLLIDGQAYFVKYKVETASAKNFRYISFIMDRSTPELYSIKEQPVIRYKAFADFMTNGGLQALLDEKGPLLDIDGETRTIDAPTPNYVVSDINLGVETLANPDTSEDMSSRPVHVNFSKLYFDVEGKGKFGFVPAKNLN